MSDSDKLIFISAYGLADGANLVFSDNLNNIYNKDVCLKKIKINLYASGALRYSEKFESTDIAVSATSYVREFENVQLPLNKTRQVLTSTTKINVVANNQFILFSPNAAKYSLPVEIDLNMRFKERLTSFNCSALILVNEMARNVSYNPYILFEFLIEIL